jgi:hypothetical protein
MISYRTDARNQLLVAPVFGDDIVFLMIIMTTQYISE